MSEPRYSKRHYEDVADIFKRLREDIAEKKLSTKSLQELFVLVAIVEDRFIQMFRDDNDRFDKKRFRKASGAR